jgi:hypothetical protein
MSHTPTSAAISSRNGKSSKPLPESRARWSLIRGILPVLCGFPFCRAWRVLPTIQHSRSRAPCTRNFSILKKLSIYNTASVLREYDSPLKVVRTRIASDFCHSDAEVPVEVDFHERFTLQCCLLKMPAWRLARFRVFPERPLFRHRGSGICSRWLTADWKVRH